MDKETKEKLESIKKLGIRAKGRKELIDHLKGKRLTRGQAILANCYDCMGFYNGGMSDCRVTECPLYPYMPYKGR